MPQQAPASALPTAPAGAGAAGSGTRRCVAKPTPGISSHPRGRSAELTSSEEAEECPPQTGRGQALSHLRFWNRKCCPRKVSRWGRAQARDVLPEPQKTGVWLRRQGGTDSSSRSATRWAGQSHVTPLSLSFPICNTRPKTYPAGLLPRANEKMHTKHFLPPPGTCLTNGSHSCTQPTS